MFDIAKLSKAIKSEQDGFTLVELMVVVVIIGVLVAIAVPIYGTITDGAERGAVEANLRTIDSAIMQYQAAHGQDEVPDYNDLEGEYFEEIESANQETYSVDDSGDRPKAVASGEVGGYTLEDNTSLSELPWNQDEE